MEAAGDRDALLLIHESATHMFFSEGIVLQLHTLLYRYMPQAGGRWKATNNDVMNVKRTVHRVCASNQSLRT